MKAPLSDLPMSGVETTVDFITNLPETVAENWMPIIGIGGSAGSLTPLRTFFRSVSSELGAAYVVITHVSTSFASSLPEILQQCTKMPVLEVVRATIVEPNHIYILSPGTQLSINYGILEPTEVVKSKAKNLAIDQFLGSLAESHGSQAVGIILSGYDRDGSYGLQKIKECGGLTIVQDPSEAEFNSMPRSAQATRFVDWVLAASEMNRQLLVYKENVVKIHSLSASLFEERNFSGDLTEDDYSLLQILDHLRAETGHDFSAYKQPTVLRRIARRMQVNGPETLLAYFEFLKANPKEAHALLKELLINVTKFFRDSEAFEALGHHIPQLFRLKSAQDSIRVWVPGCATGEEAYSIAILLLEHAAGLENPPQIRVFATDLDAAALAIAREGKYSESSVSGIDESRLRPYFIFDGGYFKVDKFLRDSVVFAVHDVLKNPPYGRLDLISCRNLFIFLNRDAQDRISQIFHFSLQPQGKVFLGLSEIFDESDRRFFCIDQVHKIYARLDSPAGKLKQGRGAETIKAVTVNPTPRAMAVPKLDIVSKTLRPENWGELLLKLIERIAAPSILIHRSQEILYMSNSAGRFLHNSGGRFTTNIIDSIHPSLKGELRAALFTITPGQAIVRTREIELLLEGKSVHVQMLVQSADDLAPEFILIMLLESNSSSTVKEQFYLGNETLIEDVNSVAQLNKELERVREQWRSSVLQFETSNNDFKAANLQLQDANVELRSTTVELEMTREELQSINEEVISINQELNLKVGELSRANGDLQNLMASTNIATIFLDRNLLIKRFTPSSAGLFKFISTDIGRPFSDLTHRLEYPELAEDSEQVIQSLTKLEREVRDCDGRWYLSRMFPYRSETDEIAGVVITCVDITERKHDEEARNWLSTIVESSNDAIISYTVDDKIVSWNKGAERIFGYTAEEMIGTPHNVLVPHNRFVEKQKLLNKLYRGESLAQIDSVRVKKDGQLIDVSLSAAVLRDPKGGVVGVTAIIQDVSARKKAVEELLNARDELENRVKSRTVELEQRARQLAKLATELTSTEQRERKRMAQTLHDDLQQILVAAKIQTASLAGKPSESTSEELENLAALIQEALASCRQLVYDLSPPVLAETLGRSLQWLCNVWIKQKYDMEIEASIDPELDTELEDVKLLIFQAVRELLFNVVKHGNVRAASVTTLISENDCLVVTIRDEGTGFDQGLQSESESNSGFGLFNVRERLEMIGGSLTLESKLNRGVTAVVTAPLSKERLNDKYNPEKENLPC